MAERTQTTLGKVFQYGGMIVGLFAALGVKDAMGYEGILASAVAGGVGGAVGAVAGLLLALVTGQLPEKK